MNKSTSHPPRAGSPPRKTEILKFGSLEQACDGLSCLLEAVKFCETDGMTAQRRANVGHSRRARLVQLSASPTGPEQVPPTHQPCNAALHHYMPSPRTSPERR